MTTHFTSSLEPSVQRDVTMCINHRILIHRRPWSAMKAWSIPCRFTNNLLRSLKTNLAIVVEERYTVSLRTYNLTKTCRPTKV